MGRLHNGYDVYLGTPESDPADHTLTFTATVLAEDIHGKVVKVKTKNDQGRWGVVYELTGVSKLQRNGTAVRWTGTAEDGSTITLSGISTAGACIPCGRR